ncbi:hypothetical protein ATE67_15510 [Sphingopyxis sp. H050]|uniref:hypothetical protein n=1 Tax=Sphingopyxis sp. H050 TaxID=1759072 RepID=UPI00073706B9|nr:hypothetical protein [Sphingopyxis sp. H050]KTE19388.1 hypothetical protein ATE67_15510 [Sphingopyxis sp. H050]
MDDAPHDPAHIPAPGSYHWTPRLQREFLEAFATNGSVKISAAKVCMSPSAVYQLKQRPEGAAFKLGCAAALLIARGRLVDELLDRAIWGHDETTELQREDGRSFVKRRRIDSRLGLAMLARLDRMVETRARPGEEMLAQIVAGDWPGFLSLFDAFDVAAPDGAGPESADTEGHSAALALWLAARDNRANPLATLWRGTRIANEVTQISADSDAEPEAEPTPEEEAAAMTVWHDEEHDEWRTNFPPPEGFAGTEEGAFGEEAYERALAPEEEDAWEAAWAEAVAPLRQAGETARRAFFALPDPANDPAPEGMEARKSASG